MKTNIAVILSVCIFSFVLINYSSAQNYSFIENEYSASTGFSSQNLLSDSSSKIKKISSDDFPGKKSPVLAGILSLFLPGTGQIYNGQWIKAGIQWIMLAGSLYLAIYDINFDEEYSTMPATTLTGLITGGAVWLWSVIDAYISSVNINKERKSKFNSRRLSLNNGKITFTLNPGMDLSSFKLKLRVGF